MPGAYAPIAPQAATEGGDDTRWQDREVRELEGAARPRLIDTAKLPADSAVAELIRHAVDIGASDLFFNPHEHHVAVLVRHLGVVYPLSILPPEMGRRCLGLIKARAGMETTERRRPLDGRWIFERGDRKIDIRINAIPTLHGEDLALRLLARDTELFALNVLGMTDQQLGEYRAMIDSPGGLVLVTGPTGSGKTATLYASLMHLARGDGHGSTARRKINTIEDPIEYAIDGLRQSQVNPAIGLTFPELLRSVLRQSPDVIMIGEIRDAETATTAIHAANSGVLVLATLHAPSAPAAVQSMRSLGGHPQFLATSLRGVVAQRLVRTLCPSCRIGFDLADAPHTFDEVRPLLLPGEGRALHAAVGCESCGHTGYAGRAGVFEVMPATTALRELITANRPSRELRDQAVKHGMLEFRHAALLKVARGETSTEEIFRVIPPENLKAED
jgi:type II secretory ATPase GspE/PulE/Tfp pilus assembly ATPase PilB-like protein